MFIELTDKDGNRLRINSSAITGFIQFGNYTRIYGLIHNGVFDVNESYEVVAQKIELATLKQSIENTGDPMPLSREKSIKTSKMDTQNEKQETLPTISLQEAIDLVVGQEAKTTLPELRYQQDAIYTGSDVIALLKRIATSKMTQQQIDDLKSDISDAIQNTDESDILDKGSLEFAINYGNEIHLDTYNINFDDIVSNVETAIDDYFENLN
jgi:hypothetical protein